MSHLLAMPELLAPAGSMESLLVALHCGASAVYVGAKRFSARSSAENFDSDALRTAARYSHLHGAKLYLAVNTLLYEAEWQAFDALLCDAVESGIDACIVQDFGAAVYLRKRFPTLPLHASTQMTIHTSGGLTMAKEMGLRRVVLARELDENTLVTLCKTAHQLDLETEYFVHGAHCMSVSGQCWMSAAMGGRSANRGRCAQPCRLPFTARQTESAYALSLKDMCLLRHVAKLQAIGINSLKIEGRMKRPEYVAAAVSAYRAALSGASPDERELRAVFSRSGFTDGYFTARRTQMFGTRQKEDVLAARDVLSGIRNRYQSPQQRIRLDAHFVLQSDQPTGLQVTDADGHAVMVHGDIPQIAQNRPTDLSQLAKQFAKLGDTIYTAGTVTAAIAKGLMLPASALNALRRQAVAAMDALRIETNTPHYPVVPIALQPPAKRRIPSESRLYVQVRHLSQLESWEEWGHAVSAVWLPLSMANAVCGRIPTVQCFLVPPRFSCDENAIRTALLAAQKQRFRHLICQHLGDIALGQELDFTCHGGLGLHCTNRTTAAWMQTYLTEMLISPEVSPAQAVYLDTALPLGRMVYGKLPLMLMRNCPIKAQIGCAHCKHTLYDRKGTALYTDCIRYADNPDYAECFNAAPIWLADRPQADAHADFRLLYMTDESAERVRDIVHAYASGKVIEPPKPFTRGLQTAADHQ